mmetsp:Transcript_10277/g.30958  ORF Transcript_10277/g.30958 Transcript_10277/m.30958 type:complete len:203 (-) Transcript_10277:766-1374(-)
MQLRAGVGARLHHVLAKPLALHLDIERTGCPSQHHWHLRVEALAGVVCEDSGRYFSDVDCAHRLRLERQAGPEVHDVALLVLDELAQGCGRRGSILFCCAAGLGLGSPGRSHANQNLLREGLQAFVLLCSSEVLDFLHDVPGLLVLLLPDVRVRGPVQSIGNIMRAAVCSVQVPGLIRGLQRILEVLQDVVHLGELAEGRGH